MRRQIVSRTLLAVGLIAGSASVAQAADEPNNVFRFGIGFVRPHGETSLYDGFQIVHAENVVGLYLGYERRLITWLGLDFQVQFAQPKFVASQSGKFPGPANEVSVLTGTAGVNFHVLGRSKFDLYLGLSGGYTDFSHQYPFSGDGAYNYGGVLGFDVPLANTGAVFTPSIRYSVTNTEYITNFQTQTGIPVRYDPIVFQIGLGYRF